MTIRLLKLLKFLCLFLIFFYLTLSAQSQNRYISFGPETANTGNDQSEIERTIIVQSSDIVEINYRFLGVYVSDQQVDSTRYHHLSLPGFSRMDKPGAPALPMINEIVALPKGSTVRIELLDTTILELKGYTIYPALEPARDTEGAPSPRFSIDQSVYSSDTFYPENHVELAGIVQSRGLPLAIVQIRPISFNPVSRTIRICTAMKVRIIPEGGESGFKQIALTNSNKYLQQLKKSVINSESIPAQDLAEASTESDGIAGSSYIIVTHSQFLTEACRLADWKRQLGYSVDIVAQDSWTATEVKEAVLSRYEVWTPKPDYLLIIGDHTGDFAVPGEIHQDPSDGEDFATDNYYVCLDGGRDFFPDMAKGRISVQTADEAAIVIDKIIAYEKTPPTQNQFYTNILNCAQYQDTDDNNGYADRRFCHTSEEIRDYLQEAQGYTSTRVYYRETGTGTADVSSLRYNNGYYSDGQLLPEALRSATFNWSGNNTHITEAINAGKFMVFHRDHGYVGGSGWHRPYYTTSTMTGLTNGNLLPLVFSMNCHTGEFQLDNCFAEKLLRMEDKGAVGVVAAAYYSYSGYNDALSIGLIDAIWPDPGLYPDFGTVGTGANYSMGGQEGIFTLGDVVNQGLYAMTRNFGINVYTFELFHYFGDPAMKIWTSNPYLNPLTAQHADSIDCRKETFVLTGSVPGATATLVCNSQILGHTLIDTSGNGIISYRLIEPGEVVLTLSKHNCLPYIFSLKQKCSDYPPLLSTIETQNMSCDKASIGSTLVDDYGNQNICCGFLFGKEYSTLKFTETSTLDLPMGQISQGDTIRTEVRGLKSNTTYHFRAYAITASDTGYSDIRQLTTLCNAIADQPWSEDFSSEDQPSCWSQIDRQGNGQIWAFGTIDNYQNGPALNGNYAYINSHMYRTGSSQDADLISPVFDFSDYTDIVLSFSHYFIYSSPSQARLSYSIDNGQNWQLLQSWTATTSNPARYSTDITELVAGYDQVLFKWNFTGNDSFYWAIDDVSITGQYILPAIKQTTNVCIGFFETDCFNATDTLYLAGNNSSVEFLKGSSVNLIAGQSIKFLPGFSAREGCLVTGSITIDNTYCFGTISGSVLSQSLEKSSPNETSIINLVETTRFPDLKIFPNPAQTQITIQCVPASKNIRLILYDSQGSIVSEINFSILDQITLDISQLKRGLYFLRTNNDMNTNHTKLLIK